MSRTLSQIGRILRVFVFALFTQLGVTGVDHLDRTAIIAAIVAAAETAYRQLVPPRAADGTKQQ